MITKNKSPNLRAAKNEAKKGENIGKLDGEESIKIKLKFSMASNSAAMKGNNVMYRPINFNCPDNIFRAINKVIPEMKVE